MKQSINFNRKLYKASPKLHQVYYGNRSKKAVKQLEKAFGVI